MKRLVAPKRSAIRSVEFGNTCLRTGVTPQVQLSILSNPRSSDWVNTRKIDFLLKSLQTSVSSLTLSIEAKHTLDEEIKTMSSLVQRDASRRMSLSRLYTEFWRAWHNFRNSLNSILETDDAPSIVSFCTDRLRKIESTIKRGEEKVPECEFAPERFDYVYAKLVGIFTMFENVITIDLRRVLHDLRALRNIMTKRSSSFFVNESDFQFCVNNLKLVIESVERIQQNDNAKSAVVAEFASCQAQLRKLIVSEAKEPKQPKPTEKVSRRRETKAPGRRRMPRYDTPEVEVDIRPTLSRLVHPKRSVTPPAARVKAVLKQVERGNRRPDADTRKARVVKLDDGVAEPKQKISTSSGAFDLKATSRRCRNEEPVKKEDEKPHVARLEIPVRRVSGVASDSSYNDVSDGPMSWRASSRMEFLNVFHAISDESVASDFGKTPRGYHKTPTIDEYEYYYSDSSPPPPPPKSSQVPVKTEEAPEKKESEYEYYSD